MVVVKETAAETVDLVEDHLTAPLLGQEMELLDKVIMVVALLEVLVEAEAAVKTALVQPQVIILVVMEVTLYQMLIVDPQLNMVVEAAVEVVIITMAELAAVAAETAERPQDQMPLLEVQTKAVEVVAEVATTLETVPITMVPLVDLEL